MIMKHRSQDDTLTGGVLLQRSRRVLPQRCRFQFGELLLRYCACLAFSFEVVAEAIWVVAEDAGLSVHL